ncbi:MAG: hypothetical protein ACFCUU_18595, partial [Cyclobacteriaceae bacterium]
MDNSIPIPTFYNQLKQNLIKKWYKKIGKIPELPWMSQKEQDILLEAIVSLKPKKCLEWGAGFSTLFFTKFLNPDATWQSIEHNKEWYDLMHSKSLPVSVSLFHVAPDNADYDIKISDGTYKDFKSYVEKPKGKFDFILIDGRARSACLKKAFELINDNGLVVMHDANRKKYHENFHLFNNQHFFLDQRKGYGGLWLGSKAQNINEIIDIDLHQSLWEKHLRLYKFFRPGFK